MLTYHYFIFKIKPSVTHEKYGQVSCGCASVLVIEEDGKKALQRARDHVQKSKWEIIKLSISTVSSEESNSQNPEVLFLQKNAKLHGISCIYDIGIRGGDIFN